MPRKGEKNEHGFVWDGTKWINPVSVPETPSVTPESVSSLQEQLRRADWDDLDELIGQIQRQRNELEGYGVDLPKTGKNPSVLSRVFDIISRPAYASAEATRRVLDPKGGSGLSDIGAAISGVGAGITGKAKTSYRDVLEEHGVKGALGTGLGLAGDIFLDPSTYAAVGLVGKVSKADDLAKALTAGTRAGSKAIKVERELYEAAGKEAVKAKSALVKAGKGSVADRAVSEALKQARVTGVPVKVREVVDNALASRGWEVAKAEEIRQLARNKPQLGIKALGREVAVPFTGAAARGIQSAKGSLIKGTFLENFSPSAMFTGSVNQTRLKHFGNAGYQTKRDLDHWRNKIKEAGLSSKDQRILVTKYLRDGTPHYDPNINKFMTDVRDMLNWFGEWEGKFYGNADLFSDAGKGIRWVDNYVPDVWRKGDRLTSLSKLGGEAEAIKKGYSRVDDIAEILTYKIDDHNKMFGRLTLANDLISQFGVKIDPKKAGRAQKAMLEHGMFKNVKSTLPIPTDVYFDPKIAESINKLDEFLKNEDSLREFTRKFDRVQGLWKFAVTVPNPGFHTRNLFSDMWTNMMDGLPPNLSNPAYRAAWSEMVAPVVPGLKARPVKKVKTIKFGKERKEVRDLVQQYDAEGLRSGYYRAEVGSMGRRALTRGMRNASEAREDYTRFAHFVHAVSRAGKAGKSFDEAVSEAADAVRTFNFDYTDFTPFEAKYVKRIIPFYSWMRKNIPLQVSLLATRPGRVAIAPKSIKAVQDLLGIESDDPMPGLSYLTPLWMDEAGGFLTDPGSFGTDAAEMMAPQLPYADIGAYTEGLDQILDPSLSISERIKTVAQGPLANVVSGITPLARIPIELVSGRNLYNQAPIRDYGAYLQEQAVPVQRYTTDPFTDRPSGEPFSVTLARVLGGTGIRSIGPNQISSELRRQQDSYSSMVGPVRERALLEWRRRNGLAP